jgi:hypothetical protein
VDKVVDSFGRDSFWGGRWVKARQKYSEQQPLGVNCCSHTDHDHSMPILSARVETVLQVVSQRLFSSVIITITVTVAERENIGSERIDARKVGEHLGTFPSLSLSFPLRRRRRPPPAGSCPH